MKLWKLTAALASAAILLVGCGGGDSKPEIKSLVSFGDSLSDVGTYKVGTVAAVGGGKYTVNGPTARNWTELIAAQYNLPAPCAAQTGLDGSATLGFFAPVTKVAGCTNYAQGGARVTSQPGPGNKLLGGTNAILGQLTVPVKDQIASHLAAVGGRFSGKELVTVLAGGNDLFIQAGGLPTAIAALVGSGQSVATATNNASVAAVTAMGVAGAELAGYVRTQILANGATNVVVINLPDVSKTPYALSQDAATQGLVNTMVTTFNNALQAGLNGVGGVLLVDGYTVSRDQAANPSSYGLTNVTTPACSKTSPANPLGGTSLTCTSASVIAGDVSRYLYADDVHPTPYGYQLIAETALKAMRSAGLL